MPDVVCEKYFKNRRHRLSISGSSTAHTPERRPEKCHVRIGATISLQS